MISADCDFPWASLKINRDLAGSAVAPLTAVAVTAKDEAIMRKRKVLAGRFGIRSAPYRCKSQATQGVFYEIFVDSKDPKNRFPLSGRLPLRTKPLTSEGTSMVSL